MKFKLLLIFILLLVKFNILSLESVIYSKITDRLNLPVVNFYVFPSRLQLFPRDDVDSAMVTFSGSVSTPGYDSLLLKVFKNNLFWKTYAVKLNYSGNAADFIIAPKIHAELSEYKFILFVKNNLITDSIAYQDSIICGDAFLINGQSNSHPTNSLANYKNEYCRSFGKNTNLSAYNPADTLWGFARGDDAVNFHTGVWGIKLQQLIKETYSVPVCIINGGSGGSSIEYNLRNNSNHADLNTTYGRLLYRVRKAHLENNIKAMFWHQGEANTDTSWVSYNSNFNKLYTAWKENYPGIKKVYVFQIRMGCVSSSRIYQSQLREVQRKFSYALYDVVLLSTMGITGHDGCHYNLYGYYQFANNLFKLVSREFYGSNDTMNALSPDIKTAYFTNSQKNVVKLIFSGNCNLIFPADTLGYSLKDYFYLDSSWGMVQSAYTSYDTLTLILSAGSSASTISYLPNIYYNDTYVLYKGPWLKNSNGIGALSFYKLPIHNIVSTENRNIFSDIYYLVQNYPNPFNSGTIIKFMIPVNSYIKLEIYDVAGNLVGELFNSYMKAGTHKFVWNAENYSSGIYFCRLTADKFSYSKKIVILK